MKAKLLNFINLIIAMGLVVIVLMLCFTTSSYAVTSSGGQTLAQLMRETISDWFRFMVRLAIAIYLIAYLLIILHLLTDRTPDKMVTLKESILRFLVMLAVLVFLHILMISVLQVNSMGVEAAKNLGAALSGLDGKNDEYDLYETALSKAYEISAVPGFVGLLMYLLLVYYTYKFVIVYVKRYINVIILILIAPLMFVFSTLKKIITGVSDGAIKKWTKEFIFNVLVQTLHAIFYATFIGFTLKLSDDDENLIGALLVLILFGFIFKIDGIIRKLFNFVGGSTKITPSKTASRVLDTTEKVGGAIGGALDAGAGKLEGGMDKLGGKVDAYKDKINENGGFFKTVGQDTKNAWNNAKEGAKNTFNNVQTKFKEIPDMAASAWESAKELPGKAWEGAKQLPGKAWEGTKNVSKKAWEGAKQLPKKTLTGAKSLGGKALKGIKGGAKALSVKAKQGYAMGKYALSGEGAKSTLTADEIVEQYHIMKNGEGLEALRQKVQAVGLGAGEVGKEFKKLYMYSSLATKKKLTQIKNYCIEEKRELENDYRTIKKLPAAIRRMNKKQEYIKNEKGLNLDVTNSTMLVAETSDIKQLLKESGVALEKGVEVSVYTFEQVGLQTFLSPVGSSELGLSVLAEDNYERAARHRVEEEFGKEHTKKKIKRPTNRRSKKAVKGVANAIKESESASKVYKFSRFNPDTARKLRKRLLKKTTNGSRYLIVINKVYEDAEVNKLSAVGTIKSKTINATQKIRVKRKNVVNTVRKIALTKREELHKFRQASKQSKRVEIANNVAHKAMSAKNTLQLGFRYIDDMSSGQLGLRRLIRQSATQDAGHQTGTGQRVVGKNIIERAKKQVRIQASGVKSKKDQNIVQFVVTETGKLVKQVVTADGKIVQPAVDKSGKMIAHEKRLEQVIDVLLPSLKVEDEATPEKPVQQVKPVQQAVRTATTENQVAKQEVSVPSESVEEALEAMNAAMDVAGEVTSRTEEMTIQHIVTTDGKLVEQVINSNNEIESERYTIISDGVQDVTKQMAEAMSAEDLELPKQATLQDKVQGFEDLLQDLQTQPLLDEILADAGQGATEEEKELDKILVYAAEKTGKKDLKQLNFGEDEEAKNAALDYMVNTGILTKEETESDDIVGAALETVAERYDTFSKIMEDITVKNPAESEFTDFVESKTLTGKHTIPDQPTSLADQVSYLSKTVDALNEVKREIFEFPKSVLDDTVDAFKDVITQEAEAIKEAKYDKELEKAEEKWARRTGNEAESNVAEKIKDQDKDGENGETAAVKITLKFYGAVQIQGQSISLTNRYSIKDFYDKVSKLENADFEATQARFMQTYGDKLKDMQLSEFSFAKSPVEAMDGWDIYVVSNEEPSVSKLEDEEIEKDVADIINAYYMRFRTSFSTFVEESNMSSFDELHDGSDNRVNLIRSFGMLLQSHGVKDSELVARKVVDNIHKDRRFRNLLEYKVKNRATPEEQTKREAKKVERLKHQQEEEKQELAKEVMNESLSADISKLLSQIETDKEMFVTVENNNNVTGNKQEMRFDFTAENDEESKI